MLGFFYNNLELLQFIKVAQRCKFLMKKHSSQETFDQGKIANCFNKFFVDIYPKLAPMITQSQAKLDQYLNPHQTLMGEADNTDDELKETLRIP